MFQKVLLSSFVTTSAEEDRCHCQATPKGLKRVNVIGEDFLFKKGGKSQPFK